MLIDPSARKEPGIIVTEVGLRDGLQSEDRYVPVEAKVGIVRALIAAGVRSFELSSFVSPRAVPQLRDASDLFKLLERENGIEFSALVANEKGMERAIEAGVRTVVMFASASESHNIKNVNRSRKDSLVGMEHIAHMARRENIELHGSIATAFSCPFEGEVAISEMLDMARAFAELGATRIKLGDTIGTATPNEVSARVRAFRDALPETDICLHFHDTRGLGLVCAFQGVAEGVRRFESSIGGLGGCPFVPEATGNIATEDLVYLLAESGHDTGISLVDLPAVVRMTRNAVGHDLPGRFSKAGQRLRTWPLHTSRTARG